VRHNEANKDFNQLEITADRLSVNVIRPAYNNDIWGCAAAMSLHPSTMTPPYGTIGELDNDTEVFCTTGSRAG
jgi:hypothetical protein